MMNSFNIQKMFHWIYVYYTSGDYVYLNKDTERPQNYNQVFILNQVAEFYITSPLKFWKKHWWYFQNYFLKYC